MGEDPSQIRQDIEHTREQMGDTVEALGHKADVPGRAKEAITTRVDSVKEKVTGATPSGGDVKQGARRAAGVAQENPLGLAVGAAAVGFVAGMLIPSTRIEDEKIGPMADQVKEKANETGQEAMERGKEVARQAAESAKETAQEAGQEQAQELRDSAQEKAQETREGAGNGAPSDVPAGAPGGGRSSV
jgi:gas vesicle protein